MRTFLENNKTKDNKFILLQPNKTKCKGEHEQSGGLGGGRLFKGGRLLIFWAFRVGAYSRWALIRISTASVSQRDNFKLS